jgi:hypothetical protein
MMCTEIVTVYFHNHKEPINPLCGKVSRRHELSCVLVTNKAGSGLTEGVIYSLYTPPVMKRNYSIVAVSRFHNSLLHTHKSSPGNAIETQKL